MNRAFVEPYAKFVLNINFFRKVVLVELRVNEVSQCRRSHQRVGHDLVKREEHLDSKRSWPRYLGQADSAKDTTSAQTEPQNRHCIPIRIVLGSFGTLLIVAIIKRRAVRGLPTTRPRMCDDDCQTMGRRTVSYSIAQQRSPSSQ
jgi:hypothetical protein